MWYRWIPNKYRVRLSIAFAFNATHNHFVLDRGGNVFKQSAPVIKLRPNATEGDHFVLLGLLNSSTACFWLKQVCHNKGSTVDELGARQTTVEFENFYEFTAGTLAELPVPSRLPELMSRRIDQRAQELAMTCDGAWLCSAESAREDATVRSRAHAEILGVLVALQEELDWRVYAAFGLVDEHLCAPDDKPTPPLELGERSFEIAMARACTNGASETTWFARHGSRPITELPMTWPEWYRELVDRRIAAIQSDRDLGLIERPEFKRRWNLEPFDLIRRRAVRERILDHVEEMPVWRQEGLVTVRVLAEMLAASDDINALVACYTDGSGGELEAVLVEILETEHVPYLAALRYKDSGLSKREDWERTWELQRIEDKIDSLVGLPKGHPKRINEAEAGLQKRLEIGNVPVPEKYRSADFQKSSYWANRGKLDVPKERFISYPNASPDGDGTLLLGWAGWDHKQQAAALGAHYTRMRDAGWEPELLQPLLAGIAELVPWLKQWHQDDADGDLGAIYDQILETECGRLGVQKHELKAWRPTKKKRGARRKNKANAEHALVEEDAG
jgi:hypothetical protein